MKLAAVQIEFIVQLAFLLKAQPPDQSADLFDEIDSLDAEELSELYALVELGKTSDLELWEMKKEAARMIGWSLVNTLFENRDLAENLKRGWMLYRSSM